ncbi:glucose 1-dehydrogenase [soil metagenome]
MSGEGSHRLSGKVAVVTGGASGIGRAIVEVLARADAAVVIADLAPHADAVASEVAAQYPAASVSAGYVDIADVASVGSFFSDVASSHGRVDVLVNCAALTDGRHQAQDVDVLHIDVEVWRRTLDVDLTGTMLVSQGALPLMLSSGGGSIINISSKSGLRGDLGLSAYSSAKGAVHSLTRSIATQFGKQGVRANVISPGHVASPSFRANVPEAVQDMLEANCLVPRLGTIEDVANAVLFLASDDSSFITGEVIRVDGGALAHLPTYAQFSASGSTADV